MKDMDALFEDEPLKKSEPDPVTEELMAEVERELEAFDAFFQRPIAQGGCGNEPLVRPETALLRTYMVAKVTKRFQGPLFKRGPSQSS